MNLRNAGIVGALMAASAGDIFSPGQTRRMEAAFQNINRQRRWRGMINCNESPWVTYRHDIRTGKAKLIKRRNKPPLLVAVKAR